MILVVGAGPVGLFLALRLARKGCEVTLIDTRKGPVQRSMAIGITPPSLDVLDELGLAEGMIRDGVAIQDVSVHERGQWVGRLSFKRPHERFPFILSLPQAITEKHLHRAVEGEPRIQVYRGWKVEKVDSGAGRAWVNAVSVDSGERMRLDGERVVACDGSASEVRGQAGVDMRRHDYAPRFRMMDVMDRTGLGAEAHLYFGPERPVESFPLPGGQRRWILRTGWKDSDELGESLPEAVHRLTGWEVHPDDILDESGFRPWRGEATSFSQGGIIFCGDAAHVVSPIGGQGMNLGLSYAAMLAGTLAARASDRELAHCLRQRREVFRVAARRAALGMGLGVMTGHLGSKLRGVAVRGLLGSAWISEYLSQWFMMRNLPFAFESPVHAVATGAWPCR
ncbi:MAG TPA: NAD(P)/FAD-dependent oxidoreductase [Kiritimatiellia bacterium]|nr:NAD(P)/FAD-dependent oxidoreductase [Kiritimatiellia bacterium]